MSADRLATLVVLAIAAGLRVLWLDREGWSNLYYAATVRSMLTAPDAVFFACYDPACFVSVDKPPVGLWLQAASAALLGFKGTSLLLPEVAAGVASVALVMHLVRRALGTVAGVVAGLALAVSPVTVATDRNTTMDAVVVLVVLLAAWATLHATETGRARWLVAGFALVGLGFNVKMLQAYLVLPALATLWLGAAPLSWPRRFLSLGVASVALAVVSLTWALAVDLTPEGRRPWVGGSAENSVMELATGHNGVARLGELARVVGITRAGPPRPGAAPPPGPPGPRAPNAPAPQRPQGVPGGPLEEAGAPGPLRLFNTQLAGQIAWLLPLALVGIAALALRRRSPSERRALLLWGTWLITVGAFFSATSGIFHRYYLVMLAPAVAALAGAAVGALWRERADGHALAAVALPIAFATTGIAQVLILDPYPAWQAPLATMVLSATFAGAILVALARARTALARAGLALATAGVLVAPATWSAIAATNAPQDGLPAGGPRTALAGAPGAPRGPQPGAPSAVRPPLGAPPPGAPPPGRGGLPVDQRLVDHLVANQGDARYLAAARGAMTASPLIVATGRAVMAFGGFGGNDRILDAATFAARVGRGEVRFVLLDDPPAPPGAGPAGGPRPPAIGVNDDIVRWVRSTCAPVPAERWRGTGPPGAPAPALYDCR